MSGNGRRMRTDERTRCIVRTLHLRHEGLRIAEISDRIGVSDATVYVWLASPRWEQVRADHMQSCETCATPPRTPLTGRRCPDPRRSEVVALGRAGLSHRQIQARTGVARSTVFRWLKSSRTTRSD